MTGKERVARAGLVAILAAAAVARAKAGADTDPSVLASPVFLAGLAPAGLTGWIMAGQLGQAGVQGWLRSGAVVGAALAGVSVLALALGQGTGLVAGAAQSPPAWITAAAALVICHVQAMRQNHRALRDQSRK